MLYRSSVGLGWTKITRIIRIFRIARIFNQKGIELSSNPSFYFLESSLISFFPFCQALSPFWAFLLSSLLPYLPNPLLRCLHVQHRRLSCNFSVTCWYCLTSPPSSPSA